ncbi:NAD(P)/FAD-dependent oxidoreductase [Elongatibacter sediminis]|uniref:FAD-dependent oxidoreductase n=1 Tax=Elongatibacter sediminis TaxID=3119006 RepID=A0AAW9RI77_9GAMM
MTRTTHDVVIVGSGIIGITIAWELRKAGREVLLVDRGEPGMECSYGNAAHFATEQIFPIANPDNLRSLPRYLLSRDSPLTFRLSSIQHVLPWGIRYLRACREQAFRHGSRALAALNEQALPAWRALLEEIGSQHLLLTPGTLQLAETPRGGSELETLHRNLLDHEVESRLLGSSEVSELLPDLPRRSYTGLYFPHTAHCHDPFRFLKEVYNACLDRQVGFLREEVHTLSPRSDGSVDVVGADQTLTAGSVVIACGVHSARLLKPLGYRVPLIAERGYHLILSEPGMDLGLPVTLHERQFIMTPTETGVRLAGTAEFAHPEDPPTMQRASMLFHQAKHVFPELILNSSSQWMGCRPTLPDYLPVIDRLESAPRVFASFGHAHLGLTQAAISAQLITDMLMDRECTIDPSPFTVNRF